MTINEDTLQFLNNHLTADPLQLMLQAHKYPSVDMRWVAQQIEGQHQAKVKWQMLAKEHRFWYPPKLNREQSSSETTARWKSQLIPTDATLADLTGGMGIDSLYFAQQAQLVHYIEMNPKLCELAEHNFKTLKINNITVHNSDSIQWIAQQPQPFHTLYIDPARRDNNGHKVAAFEDCTPNLLNNLPLLLSHCQQLIVKASPMIDLSTAEQQLQSIQREIILAVKGECKEVLFICNTTSSEPTQISCYNLDTDQPPIHFTRVEEEQSSVNYTTTLQTYLYEPNAAIMKAGAFRTISAQYQLLKLARNTHLYTSTQLITDFPGRIFKIEQEMKLTPKTIASLIPSRKAHVISRNYPVPAPTLQQKLKLHEGGEQYIIATTLAEKPIGFLCTRI